MIRPGRTRHSLLSCLTQIVENLQLITSCRARMEDLVTNDPAYSRLEELHRRREDIISVRAAAHAKLTAQTSQEELDAGDVPSSNEREDVSMDDMSGSRPSKTASAVTYTAHVPGDVDAPILLKEKSLWSSPGENERMWLNVRAKESRRVCRTSSVS